MPHRHHRRCVGNGGTAILKGFCSPQGLRIRGGSAALGRLLGRHPVCPHSAPPSRPGRPSLSSRHRPLPRPLSLGAAPTTIALCLTYHEASSKQNGGAEKPPWVIFNDSPRAAASERLLRLPISAPAYQRSRCDPGALPPPRLRREAGVMSAGGCSEAGAAPGGVFGFPFCSRTRRGLKSLGCSPQLSQPQTIISMLNFKVSPVPLISCSARTSKHHEKTFDIQCYTHIRQQIWFLNRGNHGFLTVLSCHSCNWTTAVWPDYPKKTPSVQDYTWCYFISMQKTQQNQILIPQSHYGRAAVNSSKKIEGFCMQNP